MESTAKIYISNSYQGNLNFHRHRISYTLEKSNRIYLLGEADVASASLFSGFLVGAIIIVGIMVFLDSVLTSLGATETILPYAKTYARIYVTGSIINVFTVMMNNLLTAQGAAKFTMIVMLTGSIATVISLCINMAIYVGYIAKKKGVLRFSVKNIAPSKIMYAEILKIGIPVLLFQLLASAAMGTVNTASKPYGDYAVAAMGTADGRFYNNTPYCNFCGKNIS